MAVTVTVVRPSSASTSVDRLRSVVEVVNAKNVLTQGTGGSAVEVVLPGGTLVNAPVSATPPPNPYENQVWIDIS